LKDFEIKVRELKTARGKLLDFHKILIDREKREIERKSGGVTAGQFLNLLMNDERFEWLRTISRLVVRIDEAFDLDDGLPPELLEKFRIEIAAMFDESESHQQFKIFVSERMEVLPEAESLRREIRLLIK